ncbi:MBL fold metallo-hydrolase [Paenibacillus glycanilyticus]|uniref:MBL fold metallo-hydrolase n=1 Tax=Paenibacillus glycanilyticus TaxID=126569 RepID=UPI001910DB79|nr:MBL fold metallo-hydrolase [Paenibacillus glycanilyticus]
MIELKMFPASYGDSFLLTCKGNRRTHIIIDMGFSSTYENFIKYELQKIRNDGISLLIFTHVDEDHILGGIKFLKQNKCANPENKIDIGEIWYNSFRHIQFEKAEKNNSYTSQNSYIEDLLKRGHPRELGTREVSDVGYVQGSTIASLILDNNYLSIWNKSFDYQAVMVSSDITKKYVINDEVVITLLSPNSENLDLLSQKWAAKLASVGYSGIIDSEEIMDDAFEIYMSNQQFEHKKRRVDNVSSFTQSIEEISKKPFEPDTAEINGSSIAFILEFEGKRLLFLGDSHSDVVEHNLRKLLKQTNNDEEKLWFDLVKVSHHGSKFNTSVDLLNLIASNKYVFSTNGRGKNFSHPDIETIYRIVSTDKTKNKELIFNYKPIRILNKFNQPELLNEYSYSIKYNNDMALPGKEVTTEIII